MHPGLLATALGDGCDAAVLLYLGSVLESIPILPEGSEKPGREDDARARQGSEQRVVRQCGCELCDSLIELPDELQGSPELFGKGQSFQGAGINDTGVVSQCCGCLDRLNACFDEIRSSDTVFPEEAFQGTSPGPFDLFESRPAGDECREDERFFVTEPLNRLWIVGFQGDDQAV